MRRARIIGLCSIVTGLGALLAFSARLWGIIAATALIVIGAVLAFKSRARKYLINRFYTAAFR